MKIQKANIFITNPKVCDMLFMISTCIGGTYILRFPVRKAASHICRCLALRARVGKLKSFFCPMGTQIHVRVYFSVV